MPASSVDQLSVPAKDGVLDCIRVGTWPRIYELEVSWNLTLRRWIGTKIDTIIDASDLNWCLVDDVNWAYVHQVAGSGAGQSASFIPGGGLFYQAGMRLQDKSEGRMYQTGGGLLHIVPWFHQFNYGESLGFANDVGLIPQWPAGSGVTVNDPPSGSVCQGTPLAGNTATTFADVNGVQIPYPPNVGKGNVLENAASVSVATWRHNDWQDVVLHASNADGSESASPAIITKEHLYATLYAYKSVGARADANQGRFAGYHYDIRWVSAVIP